MQLFINACVRPGSRTLRLAQRYLQGGTCIVEAAAGQTAFEPMDTDNFMRRQELIEKRDFSDPMFDDAKTFASADSIVIAAPYWDLSFPAALKVYLERVSVPGITFYYKPDGTPEGLCHAKNIIYVTTAGGTYAPDDFGFGYVSSLANTLFGIPYIFPVKAVGLDIEGADVEKLLEDAVRNSKARPYR